MQIIWNKINLETFNDVDESQKINLQIFEKGELLFYGNYENNILTLYGKPTQNILNKIVFLLNKENKKISQCIFKDEIFQIQDNSFLKTLDFDSLRSIIFEKIKTRFLIQNESPIVDCNGILLDGAKDDIMNFEAYLEILKSQNLQQGTIKTADNKFIDVTTDKLQDYIFKLKINLFNIFQEKWNLQVQTQNAQNVDELIEILDKL